MPRASKRKTAPPNSSSDQTPTQGKARSKETEQIDKIFDSYANTSLGMIDPEGVETLCADMKVGYADVRILMLAWYVVSSYRCLFLYNLLSLGLNLHSMLPFFQRKMKAQRQGYFTRDEWQTGLKALKANTLLKLVKSLSKLQKEVEAPETFEDFYSFAFKYCLTEEKQKGVDIETICELLKIVLGSQFCNQVDSLVEYLKVQKDYRVISNDQWIGFLRFCKEITFPDLGDYDENQAWPLILDNFVDWMKKKKVRY
ncbi:DCN1-like protein 4 [Linum grandiflorum]